MLFLKERFRKPLALFFLSLLLFQIGFPLTAHALTSGPTVPEATSFEPVDTTDMVNLQTGDFTYNLPLLEVPGPEGGYPLGLSYHAGIQPGEDASWTGLGWTLNPGAITRNVNGYPDDWYSETQIRRDFWEGGKTTSYSVGISFGIANTPATVSFDLAFSQDTYQGFGVGVTAGVGQKIMGGSVGLEVGVSPYGQAHAGFTASGLGVKVSGGFSTNGGYAGVSSGYSILGVSMGTGNPKGAFSLRGLTASISNDKAGNISTDNKGFNLDIPIPAYGVNLRLGYNYTRYWSDETATIPVHGSLNMPGWNMITQQQAFDVYSLLNYDPAFKDSTNIIENNDPDLVQGGSYPDFDNYQVTAQGLGGTMRPYMFQGYVARQNRGYNDNRSTVMYVCPGMGNGNNMLGVNPQFRFDNDFSNQYRQNFNNIVLQNTGGLDYPAPFDAQPVYGNADGNYGYNPTTTELAGSRSIRTIDYATLFNAADKKGFIYPSGTTGFSYDANLAKTIGGYSITNSSGVTYHYSLPAYSFNESIYSEKIDAAKGDGNSKNFNRQVKPSKYAYTWYLTGVTGPDYVDKNGNGILDEGDWGYWVKLEYGKWTDSYCWRNPDTGFTPDIDNKFQNAAKGQKEVYYLNSIKTRSHTALFVKDIRKDGRGASTSIMPSSGDTENSGGFDNTSAYTLKLNKVLLFANEDLPAYSLNVGSLIAGTAHHSENVMDVNDAAAANMDSKAFRAISFVYDYSLCQKTTNSFDTDVTQKDGKLTLKQLIIKGRGGNCMLPPTDFTYETENTNAGNISSLSVPTGGTYNGTITAASQSGIPYKTGDILTIGQGVYCGVITKVNGSNVYTIRYFPGYAPTQAASGQLDCCLTKNPPFFKYGSDSWGMYKSDYDAGVARSNPNLGGLTNAASAPGQDAWSLRSVSTPMGTKIKVDYEPDIYSTAVLNQTASFIMSNFTYDVANKQLTFNVATGDDVTRLSEIYPIGKRIKALLLQGAQYVSAPGVPGQSNIPIITPTDDPTIPDLTDFTVKSIDDANRKMTVSLHSVNIMNRYLQTTPGIPPFFVGWNVNIPVTGNLFYINNNNRFGGGLRVKSMSVSSGERVNITSYGYNKPDQAGISSGVTSYEPGIFDIENLSSYPELNAGHLEYKKKLYAGINYLLTIAREIPPPGVIYQYVTVTNKAVLPDGTENVANGSTVYEYEVFNENMITRKKVGNGTTTLETYTGVSVGNNLSIQNLSSAVGNLRSVVTYDNTNTRLTGMYNNYLHGSFENSSAAFLSRYYDFDLPKYNYQGVIVERNVERKYVYNPVTKKNKDLFTMSARESYPVILTGQTNVDYVTGTSSSSYNIGFDFYSGEVTKSRHVDIYGNGFLTEAIPAYRMYPQMGLKTNNAANKNMLSQLAANYTYQQGPNDTKVGVINATTQVWSNATPVNNPDNSGGTIIQNTAALGNVWRRQMLYTWQPDGTKPNGIVPWNEFQDFNWVSPQASNAAWKKANEITLFTVNSHALEEKDVYGLFSTSKYGYNDRRMVVTSSPARYNEVAYCGAEDDLIGSSFSTGVLPGDGTIEKSSSFPGLQAHTGYNSLRTAAGKDGFGFTINVNSQQVNRQYLASVWVKNINNTLPVANIYYQVNNGARVPANVVSTRKAGNWYQLNIITPASVATAGSTIKFSCTNGGTIDAFFDDFRVQPQNAATTTYVYDKSSGELTFLLNNANLFTRYEFDLSGRLIATYKETFSNGVLKISEHEYNFGKGCVASAIKPLPAVSFYSTNFGLI